LPRRRNAKVYKFRIADVKGYFTVGEYPDGQPGELFISLTQQSGTLAGLMDAFAIAVSYGLQNGVPLKRYAHTLVGATFMPAGATNDPEIRTANSITDYIFRRLALDYLSLDDRMELGLVSAHDTLQGQTSLLEHDDAPAATESLSSLPAQDPQEEKANNPLCAACGSQTERTATGFICPQCGLATDK